MKKTITLVAIAVALAVFIAIDKKKGEEREETQKYEASLLKIEEKEINSVILVKGTGDTIAYFRSENDNWRITSPVSTEGDQSAVRGNVGGFVNADIKRRLTTTPDKLKNFGLDPAAAEVIIRRVTIVRLTCWSAIRRQRGETCLSPSKIRWMCW